MAYVVEFASQRDLDQLMGAWRRDGFPLKMSADTILPCKLQNDTLVAGRYPVGKIELDGTKLTIRPNQMAPATLTQAIQTSRSKLQVLSDPREMVTAKHGGVMEGASRALLGLTALRTAIVALVKDEGFSPAKIYGRVVEDAWGEFRAGTAWTHDETGLGLFCIFSGYLFLYPELRARLFQSRFEA